METADRSFLGLMALSFVVLVALGLAACGLVSVIAYQWAQDGSAAVVSADRDMRPAFAFLALLAASAVAGLWSLRRGVTASLALARRIDSLAATPPPDVAAAASEAGMAGRLRFVDCADRFSFAYGALAPKVALSRGLAEHATAAELRAVLHHERYHVRRLDPLKVLLARALPATLFFLPTLRDLRARYVARRELAADRRAVRQCGRGALAGALMKVVGGPTWSELRIAAAIGGPQLLDARIEQLERGSEPAIGSLSRKRLAVSAVAMAAVTVMFTLAVGSLGGATALFESGDMGQTLEPVDILLAFGCAAPALAAVGLAYLAISLRARRHT